MSFLRYIPTPLDVTGLLGYQEQARDTLEGGICLVISDKDFTLVIFQARFQPWFMIWDIVDRVTLRSTKINGIH